MWWILRQLVFFSSCRILPTLLNVFHRWRCRCHQGHAFIHVRMQVTLWHEAVMWYEAVIWHEAFMWHEAVMWHETVMWHEAVMSHLFEGFSWGPVMWCYDTSSCQGVHWHMRPPHEVMPWDSAMWCSGRGLLMRSCHAIMPCGALAHAAFSWGHAIRLCHVVLWHEGSPCQEALYKYNVLSSNH